MLIVSMAGLLIAWLWRTQRPLPAPTYVGTTACAACHQDATTTDGARLLEDYLRPLLPEFLRDASPPGR